jgi:predicted ATPase/DNA-binding XRE family transcriptional regulator
MSDSRASFGDLLRRLRTAAALSQEDLAERAGLSRHGISDLERGARHAPRLETVRMLADALALSETDRQALLTAARPVLLGYGSPVAPPASLGSLPAPLTRLIGRQTELATLSAGLQDAEVRLLTVTGPGGVGKTRLAIAAAAAMPEAFHDGVVFVDLSPLTDAALVLPMIAGTLGVQASLGQPLIATLATFVAAKRLLLLLDNCEPVLGAAPDVVTLLAESPHLMVLATSREPLRVRGEQEFPLLPLPLPAFDHLPVIEDLAQSPAVALFLERARAVQPDFALTADTALAVAAICRHLDGLPLAIELAAARVKILPPPALLARLQQRLPLLTGGGRDLPARQRTMRNAIAWSYELLTPEEQRLFSRLAVFVGGCTLEAAEAVCPTDDDSTYGVLEGVASLVDKSLMREDHGSGGEPRYLMLETVREFALEQLQASGEEATIRMRHATWCLALAEQTAPLLRGSGARAGFPGLEREHGNLRAALA